MITTSSAGDPGRQSSVGYDASVLNSLSVSVAVLDPLGTITFINEAWKRFAVGNGFVGAHLGLGQNYLHICDHAVGSSSLGAREIAQGIRSVLRGEVAAFTRDYPCNSPVQERSYRLIANPIQMKGGLGAVIMHVELPDKTFSEQSENMIRQSQEQLEFTLESADLGYWSVDLKTHLGTRSLRHDQCFGFTEHQADWSLESSFERIHPEDRPSVMEAFGRAMAGAGDYEGEFRVIWPDESIHWLWAKGRCLFDQDGEAVAISGIVSDITERKRVSQALEHSEELFLGAFEHAPIGVALVAPTGRFLKVNRSLCELLGYPEERLLNIHFQEITHPDDIEESRIGVKRLLGGEIPVLELEKRYLRADGEFMYAFMRASVVRGPDGTPLHQIAHIVDISERVRIEQSLLDAKARLEDAQTIGKMGDWHYDLLSGEIEWSPQIYVMTGRDPRIGPPASIDEVRPIFTPESAGAMGRAIRAAVETGLRQEYGVAGHRPDGEHFDLWATAVPRHDSDGRVVALTGTVQDVTALKHMDAKLIETAREFSHIRKAIDEHALVAVSDADGRFISVNDKFCEVTQWTREELIGRNHSILNSGLHSDEFMRSLWTTIKSGNAWHGEIRNRAKDGSHYWVATTIVPFLSEQGDPLRFFEMCADITERKRAEEAFRESEELFATAFKLSPDAIWIARESDHKVIRANAAACSLWNTNEESVIGSRASSFVTWVNPGQRDAFNRRLKTQGECLNFEAQMRRFDNVLIDCSTSSRSITFQEAPCVLNVVRDVTERKKVEAAAARLAAIVTSSDDAIIGKDLNGIVSSWNAGAEKVFGYTADEMVGQPILKLVPPERHSETMDLLANIRKGRLVPTFDTVRIRKDGSLIDVAITASPIRDSLGTVIGASKVARDITERKLVEEQIKHLNEELEERVAIRTAELKAVNEELESFSYSVSHDLRSPLRAMDGYSQMLLEDYGGLLPEDGRRSLERIRKGANKLGNLIDDLLAFARLGRAKLAQEHVDMHEIVETTLRGLRESNQGRLIEVVVGDLPAGTGDATLLTQVWQNLLSNAFKYTGKREHAIVEVGARHEGEETIYFVRDNGAGFDMRYVGQLFHVFQRLHRVDEFEGTGVGLAIVQRIVQRHGGRAWAEAIEGEGATFSFTLGPQVDPERAPTPS